MTDRWTNQLSAYLDEELDSVDRAALESHLDDCGECRAALDQLRGVVGWAQDYRGSEPERDVWPRVLRGIRKSPRDIIELDAKSESGISPVRFRLPQLLAAGFTLFAVGAGTWWAARSTAPEPSIAEVIDLSAPPEGFSVEAAIHAAQTYGPAISDLERMVFTEESTLDTATVRVLREKLAIIDRAIAEAQEALARDPGSTYLIDHYTGMMKKKLSVLRVVARRVQS